MKRWDLTSMLDIGRKLFAKIHKQKHQAHHNHDIHFLARELDDWLVEFMPLSMVVIHHDFLSVVIFQTK
ncbi:MULTISPECIES: hypothetical protein [Legionella]|uniref:Uncharacterized protein n=1 Tax=Legionella rubrilucens TaxID=458 RepID=A0A0W0XVP6_9GAMM|nr:MULTISPECIES: hypothetical protein [Legionella]KTD48416.1 hypothetical protein Lrub_0767 [Legionella rubrilucens]MDX1837614.1 hypothetical protein [Legionella taurinensis]